MVDCLKRNPDRLQKSRISRSFISSFELLLKVKDSFHQWEAPNPFVSPYPKENDLQPFQNKARQFKTQAHQGVNIKTDKRVSLDFRGELV